jgi:hypothetical protein
VIYLTEAIQTGLNDWEVIENQIIKSKIKRYPYKEYFGVSLTKIIVGYLDKGLSSSETLGEILQLEETKEMLKDYTKDKDNLIKNIYICVCARFSESKRYR